MWERLDQRPDASTLLKSLSNRREHGHFATVVDDDDGFPVLGAPHVMTDAVAQFTDPRLGPWRELWVRLALM
jgi:hypothetical protein